MKICVLTSKPGIAIAHLDGYNMVNLSPVYVSFFVNAILVDSLKKQQNMLKHSMCLMLFSYFQGYLRTPHTFKHNHNEPNNKQTNKTQ